MKPYDQHMTYCPKCGEHSIVGPRYSSGDYEFIAHYRLKKTSCEYMEWSCNGCGYSEKTSCKDGGDT